MNNNEYTTMRNTQWIVSTASLVNRFDMLNQPNLRNEISAALPEHLRDDYHVSAVIAQATRMMESQS